MKSNKRKEVETNILINNALIQANKELDGKNLSFEERMKYLKKFKEKIKAGIK